MECLKIQLFLHQDSQKRFFLPLLVFIGFFFFASITVMGKITSAIVTLEDDTSFIINNVKIIEEISTRYVNASTPDRLVVDKIPVYYKNTVGFEINFRALATLEWNVKDNLVNAKLLDGTELKGLLMWLDGSFKSFFIGPNKISVQIIAEGYPAWKDLDLEESKKINLKLKNFVGELKVDQGDFITDIKQIKFKSRSFSRFQYHRNTKIIKCYKGNLTLDIPLDDVVSFHDNGDTLTVKNGKIFKCKDPGDIMVIGKTNMFGKKANVCIDFGFIHYRLREKKSIWEVKSIVFK